MYQADFRSEDDGRPEVRRAEGEPKWLFGYLFRNTTDGMWLTDEQRRLVAVNPTLLGLLGYDSAGEVTGRPLSAILADAGLLDGVRWWDGAGARRLRYRRRDGSVVEAETSACALVSSEGNVVGYGGISRMVEPGASSDCPMCATKASGELIRADDWAAIERANILQALERSRGKIAGAGGAAELLGTKPSTLRSQMKRLEIHRNSRP